MNRAVLATLVATVLGVGILTGCTNAGPGASPAAIAPAPAVESAPVASAPVVESDAGLVSPETEIDRIEVGKTVTVNYGGSDNAITWTPSKIDRCQNYIRMTVTMTTSKFYEAGKDRAFFDTAWTDTKGITHPGAQTIAIMSPCGDTIPDGYNSKPGKTYKGVVLFEVPKGQGTSVDVYGSDGELHTLDITGM